MENSFCSVIWSTNCVYMPNSSVAAHSHKYYHYLYVKSGGGRIEIDSINYDLIPGQMFMMQKEVLHAIHSGKDGLTAYEIKFNSLDPGKCAALNSLPHSLDLSADSPENIFESIFTELQNMNLYYELAVQTKLEELLLLLLRCNGSIGKKSETTYSQKFSDVLFYMNKNLARETDLKTLADIAHMEKIYFVKAFKAEIGTTPMSYLRMLRINAAKKLLVNSDMNITQISNAVGFQTIHHFTGVFKKTTGKSPTEYKLEKKKKSSEFL